MASPNVSTWDRTKGVLSMAALLATSFAGILLVLRGLFMQRGLWELLMSDRGWPESGPGLLNFTIAMSSLGFGLLLLWGVAGRFQIFALNTRIANLELQNASLHQDRHALREDLKK